MARGMGRLGEAPTQYGISFNSTWARQWGGEMPFGLVAVWTYPHQTYLSSLDEVVQENWLILINLGNNWAYTFVQLNKNVQHIPLSGEGHLSTMTDGMPSRSTCAGVSANYKYENYFSMETRWCTQKD